MKDIMKMTIEVDRRTEHKGAETIYSDLRVWIRMEARDHAEKLPAGWPNHPGLHRLSHLCINDEGPGLFAGRVGHLVDGYHHLKVTGELWVFFDDDRLYHGDATGEALIPYRRVTIPIHCQRIISANIAEAITKYDAQEGERESILLDYSNRLQEWSERYGQGKGRLVVEGPEEEIEALKGEATFDRSWDTITALALNTTYSKDEEGVVRIYKESPNAFMWSAGRMNGGLINHGGEGAPHWSVHT